MPPYLITTTCRATVRERWKLEAESEEDARAIFESDGEGDLDQVADDETVGDEEDREIESIALYVADDVTPPASVILEQQRILLERGMLLQLTVRLFRVLTGPVQLIETAAAVMWLHNWIDGIGHGPIGGPMLWPTEMVSVCNLLRQWGFQPTPSVPAFVTLIPPAKVARS